ncbi:V-type ATP synthase subunit E [Aerococcus sp. 1KP-2016]|uniref:V-type ATP synthase subunit E n=1 Tax=Aerococcus sp. 1KP-2016 TaxID=1981982 RepID=UPI000B9892EC|nr:V-type ATP synthase subunit E [Aerococcus sp. 1KP-2016]OYQ66775.1 hypothetical protein B9P78_05090 [Aerococcus sp. 1KP-2016]
MDLEDKFAYFETQVNKQVQDVIDEQVNQYKATLQKDYNEYKQAIQREYDAKYDNAQKELRKEFNKHISQSQINQQRELYVQEEKLKKSLFTEFNASLQNYMQTPAYKDQLITMIQNVKRFADQTDEEFVVYINQTDAELLDFCRAETSANVQISDRDFIGGTRGVLKERQILIDYSFSTLLSHVEEEFTIKEVDD